jgi:hypothetical protein
VKNGTVKLDGHIDFLAEKSILVERMNPMYNRLQCMLKWTKPIGTLKMKLPPASWKGSFYMRCLMIFAHSFPQQAEGYPALFS